MKIDLKIPAGGESVTEVTITRWVKQTGDYVEMDEVVAEIESEKATVELNATKAGVLNILVAEGSDVKIGEVAATIDTDAKAPEGKVAEKVVVETPAAKPVEVVEKSTSYASGVPSPAAAKILSESGVPANQVNGTGRDGRITKEDAINAASKSVVNTTTETTNTTVSIPTGERTQTREKMSNLRKAVARRLVQVKNETAMLTTFNEVNMQPVMDLRNRYKDKFKEKHGVGLGFMSFFTRAVVLALQKFPAVNAYIDGTDIVYNNFCDISVAVSGPKGLMVPIIRNAEMLSMWDIEKEIAALAVKARENKLSIEEMTGGTFTISNGGVFGSMLSTPIINPPQSAILGMHNIVERPVAEKGQVVIRPVMYVALSYDHRIIDGRESVGFLVAVKQMLENPELLLTGKNPLDALMGM
jgi:2-oxoglutarate dehydrogenase E2 component (dihydrolipoamide succinyltransferase)